MYATAHDVERRRAWILLGEHPFIANVVAADFAFSKFANTTRVPAEKSAPVADDATKSEEAKAKRAAKQKAKLNGPLPTLKWTKLRTNLSVEDAEARMHIREFVVRFFSKALPKAHLEEMECVSGNGRNRYEEDEIVPWVSEACLKSVILAFLSVLAEEETNAAIKKVRRTPY
jgi:hypothetical protein